MQGMRHLTLLIALGFVACATSDDDSYPLLPGGGDTGVPIVSGGAGSVVQGRICMIVDPRFLDACTTTGAGGLTVSLGGETSAITTANGSFALQHSTTTLANLSLTVSGPDITPSLVPATATAVIPVINNELFTQMLTANDVMLATGTGSIIAGITTVGDVPAVGASATSTPTGAFGPFFDGTSATAFTLTGTGQRGITWFTGLPAGTASLNFTQSGGSESTVGGVQVIDGGITFVDSVLP
jgi:hypothetical protein